MKEEGKTSEKIKKNPNEMERSNTPDKEFKVMDIKMLTKLRERMDKHSKNLNKETENVRKDQQNYQVTQLFHLWLFSEWDRNTNLKRYMHPCVHCNIIYSSQPKCPSVYEWIRKMLNIYTMEYYSVTKRLKSCHL